MAEELSILIWLTSQADILAVSRLLQEAGLAFKICGDVDTLVAEASRGCGAVVLAEKSLAAGGVTRLNDFLEQQPHWSALPVILLVRSIKGHPEKARFWRELIANLILVERPVAAASFISVLESALRARRRQLAIRDLLDRLKRSNEELEEKVRERTDELERSNCELERFAYAVSHDLREPLRSVTGFLDLLKRRYQGRLDARADKFINYAVEGGERLDRMIVNLLDYSRIQRQEVSLEPVDLADVWSVVVKNLQVLLEETGPLLKHDPWPVVSGDEAQLTRLFQNLTTNAIKFCVRERPEIHIGVQKKPGHWLISFRDNGIGIGPEYHDRIFQMFQRLHSVGQYPGIGMGLSICKKIVECHDGSIWLESEPGRGTIFYFTLKEVA